jgi:hypothetical protein
VSLLFEAAIGGRELEWPEEVVGLLESGSACDNLVDEVLDAVNAVGSELAGDDAVVSQRDSGAVNLTVASLVDQLGNVRAGEVSVGNERLNDSDHVPGGFVKLDKHAVVELAKSEELQDLLGLGGKLVDTEKHRVRKHDEITKWLKKPLQK